MIANIWTPARIYGRAHRVARSWSGQSRIVRCLDAAQRRTVALILVLCLLLVLLTAQTMAHARAWFNERWTPVSRWSELQDITPPLTSDLNNSLAAWIRSQTQRALSDAYVSMLIRETFANAQARGQDPFLMLAIMQVESRFDYTAVSKAGAVGLLQVLPSQHMNKITNIQHVYDPKRNIQLGTQIFAEYRDWYKGDVQKALLQYNGSLHLPDSSYAQKVLAVRTQMVNYLERELTKA